MLMALTLISRGAKRNIMLFDTFDGMTPPAEVDKDINGHSADEYLKGDHGERLAELVAARAGLEQVKEAMASTGYDPRMIYYIEGDVSITLPKTQTFHIALLRLDTDFYDSTLAELDNLYTRVNAGGVVIIDDFGHWQGARQAFNEYFQRPENINSKPFLWSIDYTGRGFIKIEPYAATEVDRYDYIPPEFDDPGLLGLFPFAEPINPWRVKWRYLRPGVPHIFRNDTRNERGFEIGNASYEEAAGLYTIARQFAGKRGLEIGSHFGWTGAHLKAAGLELDLIDPALADPKRISDLKEVLDTIETEIPYRLWPLYSPGALEEVAAEKPEPWSFVFIDGDHDGDSPENDAKGVIGYCAEDAVVMFHDMTSPDVARGLAVFQDAGWNVRIYNTMQVLGIAWRGNVTVPAHTKDPSVPHLFLSHLDRYNLPS